jgi:hypothetical protein
VVRVFSVDVRRTAFTFIAGKPCSYGFASFVGVEFDAKL